MNQGYDQLGAWIAELGSFFRELEGRSDRWPGHDYPYAPELGDEDILSDADFFEVCSSWIPEQREAFRWADKLCHLIKERFSCNYQPEHQEFWICDEEGGFSTLIENTLKLMYVYYGDSITR